MHDLHMLRVTFQLIPISLNADLIWIAFLKYIRFRGESKPEHRSSKRTIAGTTFQLEFLVGWYYDADATMAAPELY